MAPPKKDNDGGGQDEWKSDDADNFPSNNSGEVEPDFDFSNPQEMSGESAQPFDDAFESEEDAKRKREKRKSIMDALLVPAQPGSGRKAEINKLYIPLICGVTGASFLVKGFLAGAAFGSLQGLMEGAQLGLVRQPGFGRALAIASVQSGASMSLWLSTYSATHCAAQLYRGKSDIINTLTAGFVSGVVVTAKSRNPRYIIMSGIGNAAVFSALELVLGGGGGVGGLH